MSAKRSKIEGSTSRERIRRASEHFGQIPDSRHIELMVKAGLLTEEGAERARKKLAEVAEAEAASAASPAPAGVDEVERSIPQAG